MSLVTGPIPGWKRVTRMDDAAISLLIDQVSLWTDIRKIEPEILLRKFTENSIILGMVQSHITMPPAGAKHDIARLVDHILNFPAVKKHMLEHAGSDPKFAVLLDRYARTYLPDSQFEIGMTYRYNLETPEATITSRAYMGRNSEITNLTGFLESFPTTENSSLIESQGDFSVVIRGKNSNFLLGPARFLNHDCNPNANLRGMNRGSVVVVVIREIKPGDEITVSYGGDYFGADNRECLCATCESRRQNGWQVPSDGSQPGQQSDIGTATSGPGSVPRRSKRLSLTTPGQDGCAIDYRPTAAGRVPTDYLHPCGCQHTPVLTVCKRCAQPVITPGQAEYQDGVRQESKNCKCCNPEDDCCNRCIRHQQLYGTAWPNTKRSG